MVGNGRGDDGWLYTRSSAVKYVVRAVRKRAPGKTLARVLSSSSSPRGRSFLVGVKFLEHG